MADENNDGMAKGLIIGFITGSVVGAVLALLYAPKSGKEMRRDIKDKTNELVDKGEEYLGKIIHETNENVEFQPKGSKDRETIAKSKIKEMDRRGRPILVGTVSIERSELISGLLEKRGIPHQVLNAKPAQAEREASRTLPTAEESPMLRISGAAFRPRRSR